MVRAARLAGAVGLCVVVVAVVSSGFTATTGYTATTADRPVVVAVSDDRPVVSLLACAVPDRGEGSTAGSPNATGAPNATRTPNVTGAPNAGVSTRKRAAGVVRLWIVNRYDRPLTVARVVGGDARRRDDRSGPTIASGERERFTAVFGGDVRSVTVRVSAPGFTVVVTRPVADATRCPRPVGG